MPEMTSGPPDNLGVGLVLTDEIEDMPELQKVFGDTYAHAAATPKSQSDTSATTATAAHSTFRKDAATFLSVMFFYDNLTVRKQMDGSWHAKRN